MLLHAFLYLPLLFSCQRTPRPNFADRRLETFSISPIPDAEHFHLDAHHLKPGNLRPGPPDDIPAPLLLVGLGRVELPTSPLSGVRSSQLSYRPHFRDSAFVIRNFAIPNSQFRKRRLGGAGESRTPDPLVANQVLSQLSYSPEFQAKQSIKKRSKLRFSSVCPRFPNCKNYAFINKQIIPCLREG